MKFVGKISKIMLLSMVFLFVLLPTQVIHADTGQQGEHQGEQKQPTEDSPFQWLIDGKDNGAFDPLKETIQQTGTSAYGTVKALGVVGVGISLVLGLIGFGMSKNSNKVSERQERIVRALIAIAFIFAVPSIFAICYSIGVSI